jgi:mono/diheme cytochrome c family protein
MLEYFRPNPIGLTQLILHLGGNMLLKNPILLGIAGLFLGALLLGQGTGITQTNDVTIKKVSISQSQPESGAQMYLDYCAACHGKDARGNGAAGPALKVPATDLTSLAKKNKGVYPSDHIGAVLEFGVPISAHGSAEMPVWGSLFRSLSTNATSRAAVNQRIANLNKYIQSLQVK